MGAIMERDPVPFATVQELGRQVRELQELQRRQQATQAELIRWCVQCLRMDPRNHRLRGHETATERARIIKENQNDKAKALVYLEWLATQLENQSVRSPDSDPSKGTDPCTQASSSTSPSETTPAPELP